MTSYVRKYEPHTTYDETMAVYAGALIAQASTMWTGGLIEKRIGPRLTLLLGGYIFTAGNAVVKASNCAPALTVRLAE